MSTADTSPKDHTQSPHAPILFSTDDKTRILQEEQFRYEVKRQLDQPESRGGKIGKVINSAFALWILSAIFISGGGTVYSCYDKERDRVRAQEVKELEERKIRLAHELEAESERKARVERLDTEISYRLSQVLLSLRAVSEQTAVFGGGSNPQIKLRAASATMDTLTGIGRAPEKQAPLYPDYATWALPTLMAELRRHVPPGERGDIDRSTARLLGMASNQVFKSDDPGKEAASTILHEIMLRRWRDTSFYYVDCRPSEPFC